MRGTATHRVLTGVVRLLSLLLLVATAACARGAADTGQLPVPTFAESSAPSTANGSARADGLPDDCAEVLTADDLGALFAMPVASVVVRTVRGVPEPSVGRTERVACSYLRAGANAGTGSLVEMNIARYVDVNSAAKQWQVNSAAERSGATSRDLPIGAATAVLVEHPGETVLLVTYRVDTLTFVLPTPAGGGRPPGDVLVDLALRVIPKVTATAPATSAPPVPPLPGPPGGGAAAAAPQPT